MKRRQMLAVLSSVGVTAIAGCSGGDGGNGGSDGGNSANAEGCIPETDDLSSLLPPEDSGDFQGIRQVTSGVDVGTDNFVIGRYEGPDGDENDLLIAEYSSSSAAEENIQTVRSVATKPVTGILVDGQMLVAADAQSEQKARDLLSASDISCADQLSFSGGGSSTGTEESFSIGDPIWSQRNGSSGTRGVSVTGLQSDDPSSYSIGAATYEPVITENAIIAGNQVYNAADGSAERQLAASATKAPALVDDTVVMIADSDVVAVNVESGNEEWRYTTASPAGTIAAGEENVYVGTEAGITALSLSEGERIWNKQNLARPTDEENKGIAVVDGQVYITRLNEGYMFNGADGSQIFNTNPTIRAVFAPDGSIYEQRGTFGGSLAKVDSEGNRLWGTGGSSTPYAADADYVYATTDPETNEADDGFISAHNADDGSIDWSFEDPTDTGVKSAAVGSDHLYVGTGNRIFAVNKSNGERENVYTTDIPPQSLVLGDGLLGIVRRDLGDEGAIFLVE